MADDQGALPDPTTDNAPPTPTVAPAAAGQQQFGGGALPTGNDQTMGGVTQQPAPGPDPEKIKQYIQGAGAMPKSYYDNLRMQVEQSGITDPNDVTAHAIAQGGPPALQATRQHFDAQRGAAVKAIGDGNNDLAASEANKAFQYVPDGTKANVTATKDNFTISVHTPDGQAQNYNLTPDQMSQVFKGKDGFFDHMVGKGVNGVIDAITKAQNPEGGFGGPPAGTQQTSQGTATETTPGIPQTPAQQGSNPSFPGNQKPVPGAPNADQAPVVGGNPGGGPQRTDIDATLGRPGGPATQQSNLAQGSSVTDPQTGRTHQLPPGYTVATDKEGNQHVLPPGKAFNQDSRVVYDKPGSQVYGMPGGEQQPHNVTVTTPGGSDTFDVNRGPIAATTHGARQSANTNVGTPEQQRMAQEIHPGSASGQAQYISNQNSEAQKQASAERVARGRGVEARQVSADATTQAAQTRAAATVQAAQIKAQAVANGTDTRFNGEEGRDAANILKQMMHDNPQAPIGAIIQKMRDGGISDALIRHLVNPQSQAPQGQGTPGKQAAAQSQLPPEAAKSLQAGHVTTFGNGQKWTVGPNGQPQQVQ